MKTLLKDLLQAYWGPAMRGIAWALGHAVAIPAAVLIVMAQWLAFTWRRPLAGVLALVPVRRPDPIDVINESMAALARYRQAEIEADKFIGEILTEVAAEFGLTADELTRINFASPNPVPRLDKLSYHDPNLANDGPPVIKISPALDAALDQALGLKHPARPVATPPSGGGAGGSGSTGTSSNNFILAGDCGGNGATPWQPASAPQAEPPAPLPPVLAPAPRRQRRGSKRSQGPA